MQVLVGWYTQEETKFTDQIAPWQLEIRHYQKNPQIKLILDVFYFSALEIFYLDISEWLDLIRLS